MCPLIFCFLSCPRPWQIRQKIKIGEKFSRAAVIVTSDAIRYCVAFCVGVFLVGYIYSDTLPNTARRLHIPFFLLSLSSLYVAGRGCSLCVLHASRGTGVKPIPKTSESVFFTIFIPWPGQLGLNLLTFQIDKNVKYSYLGSCVCSLTPAYLDSRLVSSAMWT